MAAPFWSPDDPAGRVRVHSSAQTRDGPLAVGRCAEHLDIDATGFGDRERGLRGTVRRPCGQKMRLLRKRPRTKVVRAKMEMSAACWSHAIALLARSRVATWQCCSVAKLRSRWLHRARLSSRRAWMVLILRTLLIARRLFTRFHKPLCDAGKGRKRAISGFIRMLRRGYNSPKLTCWKGFCRTIERTAC